MYLLYKNRRKTVNSEVFTRIIFSIIVLKRHICYIKNSQLGHYLPISVKDTVISPFREDFIFTNFSRCEVLRK